MAFIVLLGREKRRGKYKKEMPDEKRKGMQPSYRFLPGNNFVNTSYVRWINQATNNSDATYQTSLPLDKH